MLALSISAMDGCGSVMRIRLSSRSAGDGTFAVLRMTPGDDPVMEKVEISPLRVNQAKRSVSV